MMPEKDIWPMSNSWSIRLHKAFYPAAREALASRYGKPESAEEYSTKSQVLQLEATKGMFEAYAGNKYKSSGIIYWMYNSAWPKLYWQFFDYYFAPNGAFYGAKNACEPLHIQYSYADSSIYVVNGLYKDFNDLKASFKLYDFNMKERLSKEANVNIPSDGIIKVISFDKPKDLSSVYFLKLGLKDPAGKEISSNFYWLSLKGDNQADFTDLNKLPKVDLKYSVSPIEKNGTKYHLTLDLENPSSSLAFSVNPKIIKEKSKDLVTPIFWDDNYFSLLPNEKRTIQVNFDSKQLDGEEPVLQIEGWNVRQVSSKLK